MEQTVKQKLTTVLVIHVYIMDIVSVIQLDTLVNVCKDLLVSKLLHILVINHHRINHSFVINFICTVGPNCGQPLLNCETDGSQCGPQGTCTTRVVGPSTSRVCTCNPGYTGDFCTQPVTGCTGSPCYHQRYFYD